MAKKDWGMGKDEESKTMKGKKDYTAKREAPGADLRKGAEKRGAEGTRMKDGDDAYVGTREHHTQGTKSHGDSKDRRGHDKDSPSVTHPGDMDYTAKTGTDSKTHRGEKDYEGDDVFDRFWELLRSYPRAKELIERFRLAEEPGGLTPVPAPEPPIEEISEETKSEMEMDGNEEIMKEDTVLKMQRLRDEAARKALEAAQKKAWDDVAEGRAPAPSGGQ